LRELPDRQGGQAQADAAVVGGDLSVGSDREPRAEERRQVLRRISFWKTPPERTTAAAPCSVRGRLPGRGGWARLGLAALLGVL